MGGGVRRARPPQLERRTTDVGLDPTWEQLRSARAFQRQFGIEFALVSAGAESVPLADESFDVVISEYGASIWSDPHLWVSEAARLLRPGGELVFLVNGTQLMLCVPDADGVAAGDRLLRALTSECTVSNGLTILLR